MTLSRWSLAIFAVLLISVATLDAVPKDDETGLSSTSFVVLKDDSGKPVRNASVILHPVDNKGRQMKAGFQLKTDGEGKTHFDGVPFGLLRVQVIAHGFQTFGDDYQINQADQQIMIRLKRPQEQYSIYDQPDGSKPGGTGSSSSETPPPPQKQ
jgi:hypothetical protein